MIEGRLQPSEKPAASVSPVTGPASLYSWQVPLSKHFLWSASGTIAYASCTVLSLCISARDPIGQIQSAA